MEKPARSQVAKGLFLVLLLLVAPFISSSSLRSSYLYFLLNILIVALGVEAGFIKAISRPHDQDKKHHQTNLAATPVAGEAPVTADKMMTNTNGVAKPAQSLRTVLQKVAPSAQTLKRCSSKPSLFFIGGWEGESTIKEEEEVVVEEEEKKMEDGYHGELSKQELFAKAEAFIGNFYMQLKMQREESWKKIHGLCRTAF
ncbi:hypothetical protein Cni_G01242 [Canna indica]|uniref:DUF4408 domain-containing protein n=1 Tax=Canna indica TaxID=4628 RepID=A0AAQ3JMT4_9LILI|nr:hypothetical protein Cni_G01242 [Canna indica]